MLALLAVVAVFVGASDAQNLDSSSKDYKFEVHNVTTSDGYILQLHRILPHVDYLSGHEKVVFLMHAVPFSSDQFIYLDTKYGIGYNFANAGFDVWMGNARGNVYSRRHVSLDPEKNHTKFFDFTYEEIALYDLPAMVDYALKVTKQKNLHFIGHSEGGTVFLVLNSMETTHHSKFASAFFLAGMGDEYDFPNANIKLLSNATDVIDNVLEKTGTVELRPLKITNILLTSLVNSTVPDSLIAGTSIKQLIHFAQNIRDGAFRRFDYGADGNLARYGTRISPSYNMSVIPMPCSFYLSSGDTTVSESDAQSMASSMPNAKVQKIASDSFGNMDYILSKSVKELVTDRIIQALKK